MTRADDYANMVTALGTNKDKSQGTFFASTADLTAEELEDLYEKQAIAARVVDRVVDDATREGFTLTGTDRAFDWESVKSGLDDLDARNQLGDAWRWSRLYGGSLVIMNVDDNLKLHQPMALDRARSLRSLEIIESRYVTPSGTSRRLGTAGFRKPRVYDINAPNGVSVQIHSSRVIRFDGVRVPPSRLLDRNGWGPSVLDKVWSELRRLGSSLGYAEAILHEISIMMLSIEGFRDAMSGSADDKRTVQAVFERMRWGIDALNTLVLDSRDSYTESARNVSGLDALLKQFIDSMVRSTDMPRTILLGEQPGGLNASADSEVRAWYDHVAHQQKQVLTPALGRLLSVMFEIRSKRGEPVPDEWTIEWEPLWQPTDKEVADAALVRAQTAQILQTVLGAASSLEIRKALIEAGDITPVDPLDPEEGEEFGS